MSVPSEPTDEAVESGTGLDTETDAGTAVMTASSGEGQPDETDAAVPDAQPSGLAEPSYELLGEQSCGKKLPVSRIVRELEFARFITLAETPVDVPTSAVRVSARPLVMPLSTINLPLALESTEHERPSIFAIAEASLSAASPPASSDDEDHEHERREHERDELADDASGDEPTPEGRSLMGTLRSHLPGRHLPGEEKAPAPASNEQLAGTREPLRVPVSNITELIATRKINIPRSEETERETPEAGMSFEVVLNAEVITALLTEGAATALLRNGDGFRVAYLDATKAKDAPEAVRLAAQHEIANVAAFLARPTVYTWSGRSVDVPLEPEHVKQLLDAKAATVTVENQEITLEPRTSSSGAPDLGFPRSVPEGSGGLAVSYAATAGRSGESALSASRPQLSRPVPSTTGEVAIPTRALAEPVTTEPTIDPLTVVPVYIPPVIVLPEKPKAPEVGFYVPYRQTWTLLGYSLGALLNTISLAPQEETTIELFTWDRRTNALEQTSASEVEQTIESTDATKDTTQVLAEVQRDSDWKANGDVRAKGTIGVVEVGGGGSVSGGSAAKDVAKTTTDFIHEQTSKAVTRVKASRQSKVSESHEFGSEERTTRRIRNVNMCHPLHLDYFEVLVDYEMKTVCLRQEAQLVVLLDLPKSYNWWSRDEIRRFEPVLRAALLDRAFVGGFDASRLLAARECAFRAVCERSKCDDDAVDVNLADGEEFEEVKQAALRVIEKLRWFILDAKYHLSDHWVWWAFQHAAPPRPAWYVPNTDGSIGVWLHQWLFVRQFRNKAPDVWSALLSLIPTLPTDASQLTPKTLKRLHLLLTPKPPTAGIAGLLTVDQQAAGALKAALRRVALQVYQYMENVQAIKDLASFVKSTTPDIGPLDDFLDSITDLVAQGVTTGVVELAAEIGIGAVDAKFGIADLDDQGLMAAITVFEDAYDAWQTENANLLKQAAETASALDTLANQRDDQIRAAFPLSAVAEACEREGTLMMHLDENSTYYSFAVYQAQLASGATEPPKLVDDSGGLFMSNAIGMVNGKLAFPVNFDALGTNQQAITKLRDWFDTEIRDNVTLDQGPAATVESLPTPGITLTTRLGICSGCDDFITKTREIDLRQRTALAEQHEHEAQRRADRLTQNPPQLDDPVHHDPAVAVRLLQEAQAAASSQPLTSSVTAATTGPTQPST